MYNKLYHLPRVIKETIHPPDRNYCILSEVLFALILPSPELVGLQMVKTEGL